MTINKPGLYTGIKEPECDKIDALRSSDLKLLLRSAAHYKAEKDGFGPPITPQRQKAWDMGDAFHAAVLEPDRFKDDFVLIPEFSGKGSRTDKAAWIEENQDKTPLDAEDCHLINNMKVSVMNHPEASQLLKEVGLSEVTGFFIEPEYDVPCKIRIDRLNKARGKIIDLKTSGVEIFPKELWGKRSYNLNYHMQAFFYSRGLSLITGVDHTNFTQIVVEKDYPHGVMVYEIPEEVLLYGGADTMTAIRIYRECLDKGEWPCYPTGIHMLGLPKFARPKSSAFYS